jgi:hypothetical protein
MQHDHHVSAWIEHILIQLEQALGITRPAT